MELVEEEVTGRIRLARIEAEDLKRRIEQRKDDLPYTEWRKWVVSARESTPEDFNEDDHALKPDPGSEDDFQVNSNPFAFSPGQLNKMLQPKSLATFQKLGGLNGLEKGLRRAVSSRLSIGEHISGRHMTSDYKESGGTDRRFSSNSPSLLKRSFLPVLLRDRLIDAMPDSGSSSNVIVESEAVQLGASIDRSSSKRLLFTNACGKPFRSVGETTIELSFPDEPDKIYKEVFAVIKQCAAPFVLGDAFLKKTEIFTRFRHRLKRALSAVLQRKWRLMHMDIPRYRLECSLNAENVYANVDSGSDIDLISLKYLRYRGWKQTRLPSNRGHIELADGSMVRALGYVDRTLEVQGSVSHQRFYVLDGLICDVLLGDETIDRMDLYEEHSNAFVELEQDEDEGFDFQMLQWVDSIDDCVEQFLQDPALQIPAVINEQFLQRATRSTNFARLLQRLKPNDVKDRNYRLLLRGLMAELERLDIVESDESGHTSLEMASATGDKLNDLIAQNQKRKSQHAVRRQKLLELKDRLLIWKTKSQ